MRCRCDGVPGKSPFYDGWRALPGPVTIMMPPSSERRSLYTPATETWSGFVPDFVKLMSGDLGFAYSIVNEDELCAVETVEYFRAFLRNPLGLNCTTDPINREPCCLVAEEAYSSDLLLFELGDDMSIRPSAQPCSALLGVLLSCVQRAWACSRCEQTVPQLRRGLPLRVQDRPQARPGAPSALAASRHGVRRTSARDASDRKAQCFRGIGEVRGRQCGARPRLTSKIVLATVYLIQCEKSLRCR